MLFALSKMATSSAGKTMSTSNSDAMLISQAQAAAAVNPRISRALRELQAAEALLVRTKIANSMGAPSAAGPGPSPWMFNPVLRGPQSTLIPPPLQAYGIPPAPTLITPTTSPELAVGRKSLLPGPPMAARLTRESSDAMSTCDSSAASICPDSQHPKEFVQEVRENDILCGRGGKSNHHPGNKKYRLVVSKMKMNYRKMGSKMLKTDLSRAIVEHVYGYGGRFLKYDTASSQYVVLSPTDSRKKTSQALREMKEVKWIS
jgi:hypothetical protein